MSTIEIAVFAVLVVALLAWMIWAVAHHKGPVEIQYIEAAVARKAALEAIAAWEASVIAEQTAAAQAASKAGASAASLSAFKAAQSAPPPAA